MAGRIPQAFIDELLNRTDIVDVIDTRVQLKKAGREYKACCPFHNEKTPSFTVSQTKQFYHCFGCGAHGTAISFLMDYEHMDFVEAIEELAHRAGLEVPREAGDIAQKAAATSPLYELLGKVADYYQQQLREHPQRQQAVDYLKQRGLSGEVAARFHIGYAPPGWENLVQAFGSDPKTRQALQDLGLVMERENSDGHYDRFRNRIQFPIHDRRGRTIGFGGRVLDDGTPKYMNSPESEVFHKGRELYGLHEARKAVRKLERILVVEGYMDVVALAQFDINYAVATLGTATTPEHVETLFRTVPEIIFCFDGDRAGREAAWRALENTLPSLRDGREARFLFLPEGEDPDSLVRKIGREAFEAQLGKASHLSDFFFERLSEGLDTDSIDGRARLVNQARPLLEKLPEGMFRQLMLERLAEMAHTSIDSISGHVGTSAPKKPAGPPRRQPPRPAAGETSPVREAIAILLHDPALAGRLQQPATPEPGTVPGVDLLKELLDQLFEQPGLGTAALLEHWRGREAFRHLSRLASWEPPTENLDLLPELQGRLRQIQQQHIEINIKVIDDIEADRALTTQEKRERWDLQLRLKQL